MAAIVTDTLTKNLSELFLERILDGQDSDQYFIGLGKSDKYGETTDTVIDPRRTLREEREIRNNIQSVKKVEAASFVIPKFNWTEGQIYSAWSDDIVGYSQNSFYVLTEDNEVYICIHQAKDGNGDALVSLNKPSFSEAGVRAQDPFETEDGYRWKFAYSLSSSGVRRFMTASFMPCQKSPWKKTGDSASLTVFELQQRFIEASAIPGQIIGVDLIQGGSGYNSPPSVLFIGDGQVIAEATATIAGGEVVKIEMNNESAALGRDYTRCHIEFAGGDGAGAIARPILGPINGLGYDARDDLKSSSILLNIKPNGSEEGKFIVGNDFRQISLLKNIQGYDDSSVYTEVTGLGLRTLVIENEPEGNFTRDNTLLGRTSGARAFIDDLSTDSDGQGLVRNTIKYHQNEKTGFQSFINGEQIQEVNAPGEDTIISATTVNPDFDAHTGELLYLENRARVVRDADQQEDIKIIITA